MLELNTLTVVPQPSSVHVARSTVDVSTAFAQHVAEGLRAERPFLSSRFIYDERGSKLFQDIMALDAYYLTRCEFEILTTHVETIVDAFTSVKGRPLELIELGAGDGSKTKIILAELLRRKVDFVYRPIDISADILAELGEDLRQNLPGLRFEPITGTYAETLADLRPDASIKRVLVFLGSNLGNFSLSQAGVFLQSLKRPLLPGDQIFLGIDLRKDPRRILAAYDDDQGVTAAFNLNLLHRLSNELGAVLDLEGWGFYPTYNPETGEVRSYLYPIGEQRIRIASLGLDRNFSPSEVIHTEVSRKYTFAELETLALGVEATLKKYWGDDRNYFTDVLFEI